jgi:hypothetical protein
LETGKKGRIAAYGWWCGGKQSCCDCVSRVLENLGSLSPNCVAALPWNWRSKLNACSEGLAVSLMFFADLCELVVIFFPVDVVFVLQERGLMDTFEQLVDAALSQDRAHEVLSDALPPGTPYFRLQPTGPQFASRLDEIRKSELQKAQASARAWIAENSATFDTIAAILNDDKPDQKRKDDSESADDTSYIDDISEDEEGVKSSYMVKKLN